MQLKYHTSKDIVDSNNGIAGCPDMLTDGIWLWPGDLAYYVKRYHLKLDEDFLQSMRAKLSLIYLMISRYKNIPLPCIAI